MALLELDAADTEALIAEHPQVTVAVYASPRQTVIAGPPEQIDQLIAAVAGQDRLARRVDVDVASHHPIIDPILPELRAALAGLAREPRHPDHHHRRPVPVRHRHSTPSTGRPTCATRCGSARPSPPPADEHTTFIEISPHPLLTHAITDILADTHHHASAPCSATPTTPLTFHTNLNATHTTLPPRTPHPPEPHPPPHHPLAPHPPLDHHHARLWWRRAPLLGIGVTDPTNGTRVWESTLSPDYLRARVDHCVDDGCVLPGAAYAELALAAVTEAFGPDSDQPWMIGELCLHRLMHITDATVVVTTLSGDESKPRVEIRSGSGSFGWTLHASAMLERDKRSAPEPPAVDEAPATELDADDLYRRLRSAGQQHGPAFQGIVGLTVSGSGAARAAVRFPSEAKQGSRRFHLHPVMVDIALQALGATKAATDLAGEGTVGSAVVLPVRRCPRRQGRWPPGRTEGLQWDVDHHRVQVEPPRPLFGHRRQPDGGPRRTGAGDGELDDPLKRGSMLLTGARSRR